MSSPAQIAREARRRPVIAYLVDGLSQREVARKTGETASYVHKVAVTIPARPKRSLSNIVRAACSATSTSPDELCGDGKVRQLARVRQATYLVAFDAGHSLVAIGRRMNRDHTTVRHGIMVARHIAGIDPDFAAVVASVRDTSLDIEIHAEPLFVRIAKPVEPVVKPDPAEKPDSAHLFHENIAAGSKAFLAALRAAQSNIKERAA